MSSAEINSVQELMRRLREGLIPRSVRLFAAQGLLPVSREELIRVVAFLAAEGDEEIAEAARTTLTTFEPQHFLATLETPELEAIDVDFIARAVRNDTIWQAIVRHPKTANETLRWLARTASPTTQDAIVTNQVRLMRCLELLDDLRANTQATPDTLRRVREFEEEFLEKAVTWATTGEGEERVEPGESIEEALRSLIELGMHLVGVAAEPELSPVPAPDAEAPREIRDAFVRLALMNTYQRVMTALKGTREERLILARDRSQLVARAVMMSPRMNESEAEQIAGMRSANDDCLRYLATRARWLRRYGVVRALVFNPRTPPGIAATLIPRLNYRDLGMLSRDRNVSSTVRRIAFERYTSRK